MPGVIESAGFSPSSRKYLFYMVCIPIRLAMVALAYKFHDNPLFKIATLLAAMFSVRTTVNKMITDGGVWWSRGAHTLSSGLIASSIVVGRSHYTGFILLADIIFGVSSSIVVKPW